MTTILQARPRRFVSTPAIERISARALRYLQSGFSIHLRGPAGTGKTTLALHLADLLTRPIMLIFGDDEFKTSDLIGNQLGYTRKKVVDNFIHSVIKVEDEMRQNWVDSRLTLACREGFTLVYDEFNRSRPEVNNVLLSALEEKLLVLPPNGSRNEYVRVNSHFRAIFTSNPEEYCGVHSTQDALLDRLITINLPEPDELTQQEIVIQKTEIDREGAAIIVQLVKAFRDRTNSANPSAIKNSGLRSCLVLAKVCHEHEILVMPENSEFRDVCQDVLLSRSTLSLQESTQVLWEVFNTLTCAEVTASKVHISRSVPDWETVEPVSVHSELNIEPPLLSNSEQPTLEVEMDWDQVLEVDVIAAGEPQATASDPLELISPTEENTILNYDFEPPIASSLIETMIEELPKSCNLVDDSAEVSLALNQEMPEVVLDDPWSILAEVVDTKGSSSESVVDTVEVANEALTEAETCVEAELSNLSEAEVGQELVLFNSGTFQTLSQITDQLSEEMADAILSQAVQETQIEKREAPLESMPVVEGGEDWSNSQRLEPSVEAVLEQSTPFEREVYQYLQQSQDARPSEIEGALGISRFQTINALRSLTKKGILTGGASGEKASYHLQTSEEGKG